MTTVAVDAHPGCYLVIPDNLTKLDDTPAYPSWCFGSSSCTDDSTGTPDIAVDPDDGIVSVMNTSSVPRTYFVTVSRCDRVWTADSRDLMAETLQLRHDYVTFVVLLPSQYSVDICRLEPNSKKKRLSMSALASVQITSDVQDYCPIAQAGQPVHLDAFPLEVNDGMKFLCTQSAGGHLTHFAHPSTYHAVDFRCPVGTPILALFDAEVVDIRNDSSNSGVRVSDLFAWNSIMIKALDAELYCEYVHVRKDSFRFKLGDKVKKGDVLCESGNVGFCPEPHLHFEIHRSIKPGADSVPILWNNSPFIAGHTYP